MAKSSGKGKQGLLLLVLLGILAGAGSWNYKRNLAIEEAEPRPYRSYTLAQLDDLRAAYQGEVDAQSRRYKTASSQKVAVRSGGLIGEQVGEFERVQRISQGKRDIASQYAKNQVRLDAVTAEIVKRAADGPAWRVVLRRLIEYP
jgi:hypothetical protein